MSMLILWETKENLFKIKKALSDKSKLEIISLLKTEPKI